MKYWSIRFCVCEMSIFSRSPRSGHATMSDLLSMAIDPALGIRVGHQDARRRRGHMVPCDTSGFSSRLDVVVSVKRARIDWMDCRFAMRLS